MEYYNEYNGDRLHAKRLKWVFNMAVLYSIKYWLIAVHIQLNGNV